MGMMDRIKNLFTVEVEEDEPIKKEVIKVEIETPLVEEVKKEVVKEPVIMETPKPKIEEKNVFFDDLEFDSMTRASLPKKEYYQKKEVKKETLPKKFNPSPVISPVYGVLGENYKKEDIKPLKNNTSSSFDFTRNSEITIDDIRKKAYGTLEDELEITLFKENLVTPEPKKKEIDLFDELEDMDSLEELNNLESKEIELLKEVKEEKLSYDDDDILDFNKDDLFDLIDSMYDKRGEE